MQACGGCSVQQVSEVVQVLANPMTWLVLLAGATTLLSKSKKKETK